MSGPKVVPVHLTPTDLVRAVARFAVDPFCPSCRGPAELTSRGGVPAVLIDHTPGCELLKAA